MLPKLITSSFLMSRHVKNYLPCFWFVCSLLCSYYPIFFQVVTPTGNVLVEDLTLKVESGSNLLITGNLFSSRSVCAFKIQSSTLPFPVGYCN